MNQTTDMNTMLTYTFTLAEKEAILGWAAAAGIGFHYGPPPPGWDDNDPSITALRKLQTPR